MTNEELSNEFDVLIEKNLPTSPFGAEYAALRFDEYEKSIFLTQAQESIVRSLYSGNLTGESFEQTEELRKYLNELVKTYSPEKSEGKGLTDNSYFYKLPIDTLFITYEAVKSQDERLGCAKGSIIEVVPVTQDEFHKIKENPFRGPTKKRVLRLDAGDSIVELISLYTIHEYLIRYVSRPEPIILVDLPDDLTINDKSKETECKLNPAVHRVILEMAVNLALKSRTNAGK